MAWTLGLVGFGVLLYRPWQTVPFDILDYSEILPFLNRPVSSLERFRALVTYYLGHGRSNVLTSALIWVHWEAFGLWPIGWRLFRVLLLGTLIWTFLRTALRFRLPLLAAGVGASLFVVGWSAVDSWLRFTAEPLAAIFLLLALSFATNCRKSPSPVRSSLFLALLCAMMVLTKETMLFTVPLVLVLALSWDRQRGLRVPALDRTTLTIAIPLVATMAVFTGIIVAVARGADAEGYAHVYGSAPVNVGHFLYNVLATSWPLGYPQQFFSVFGLLSTLAVMVGCILALRRARRRRTLMALAFLLLIGVVGAATYLPWRRFEPFYSLPFLAGPAGVLAIAFLGIMNALPARTVLAVSIAALFLIPPAIVADQQTTLRAASRQLNYDLARVIAQTDADSVVFASSSLADQPWQGRGPTLSRYAHAAFGGKTIPAVDVTCEAFSDRLEHEPRRRIIVMSYHYWCGPIPGAQFTIAHTYRSLILGSWRFRTDSLAADILVVEPRSDDRIPAAAR